MAHIYYTQASHDWEIESADVTTDQANINDRNFNTTYTVTGASASNKGIWIDRGELPMSGSYGVTSKYTPIDAIAIIQYSGSYQDWAAGTQQYHFFQHVREDETGKLDITAATLSNDLDDNSSIVFKELVTPFTLRYINIRVVNMSADPIITQVMLLRKLELPRISEIGKSHQWPRWYTKTAMLSGPHTLRHSNFRRPIQAFRQHYPLYSAANIANAQGIGKGVRGRLQPFIYQPKTTIADMYICHMSKDKERFIPIEHEHKEIVFEFEEIYRIQSGYTT